MLERVADGIPLQRVVQQSTALPNFSSGSRYVAIIPTILGLSPPTAPRYQLLCATIIYQTFEQHIINHLV